MASQPCAHCGKLFDPEGKLVCPHCGADVDLTYAWEPSEFEFGPEEKAYEEVRKGEGFIPDEDAEYQEFLEKEGLAPAKQRRGCLLALLAAPFLGLVLLLL